MIPCSGTIKASDINTELSRNASYPFKIGNTEERNLAGKPSGLIKFSDFACKSVAFDLTIGVKNIAVGGSSAAGDLVGYSVINRYEIGYINGQRPSPKFPVGYGGADQDFYVLYCGCDYANRSGHRVVFRVGQNPTGFNNSSYLFGNTMHIKFVLPNNQTFEFDLFQDDGSYANGNAQALYNAMKAYEGQVAKVTVTKK